MNWRKIEQNGEKTTNTHITVKRERTNTKKINNNNKQKGKTKIYARTKSESISLGFIYFLFICCISVYYTVFVFTLYSSAFFFHGVYRMCLVWGQFSFICLSLFYVYAFALFGHFCLLFFIHTASDHSYFTCSINRIRNVYQVSIQFACVSTFFLVVQSVCVLIGIYSERSKSNYQKEIKLDWAGFLMHGFFSYTICLLSRL